MLKLDYNRLFVGPGHIVVPLWESIYRTKEKLLFGESEITVRRYYQLLVCMLMIESQQIFFH